MYVQHATYALMYCICTYLLLINYFITMAKGGKYLLTFKIKNIQFNMQSNVMNFNKPNLKC